MSTHSLSSNIPFILGSRTETKYTLCSQSVWGLRHVELKAVTLGPGVLAAFTESAGAVFQHPCGYPLLLQRVQAQYFSTHVVIRNHPSFQFQEVHTWCTYLTAGKTLTQKIKMNTFNKMKHRDGILYIT